MIFFCSLDYRYILLNDDMSADVLTIYEGHQEYGIFVVMTSEGGEDDILISYYIVQFFFFLFFLFIFMKIIPSNMK